MTDMQFHTLFTDALARKDISRDAFVSDWTLSSMWGDSPDADIPHERVDEIGRVWDVAHLTIRDIRHHTGLSQVKFATRFCIPRRSVEDWEAGARACPDYVRLLLAQAAGLFSRRYGDDP